MERGWPPRTLGGSGARQWREGEVRPRLTVGMSESREGAAPEPPPRPLPWSPFWGEKGWESCLQEKPEGSQGYWGREGGGPGP